MAKTSVTVRNEKRKKMNARKREQRTELKKMISDPNVDPAERVEAMHKLDDLPRNSSKVRIRNRCMLTGRPRAMLTRFGLCRNEFRRLAHTGQIVGVTKSSW